MRARVRRTLNRGSSILDRDGRELRCVESRTFSAGRLDSGDIEFSATSCACWLADALDAGAELRFGDAITALVEEAAGVTATCASCGQGRHEPGDRRRLPVFQRAAPGTGSNR